MIELSPSLWEEYLKANWNTLIRQERQFVEDMRYKPFSDQVGTRHGKVLLDPESPGNTMVP